MEVSAQASAEHVKHLRHRIAQALKQTIPDDEPEALRVPARYVLDGGGKRLRPLLLLLAAEVFGVPAERAMPAALAVEVFHNFTLVHDDIMDHAETRRGRPTVHRQWDVDTAILVGDYLMGRSYALLGQTAEDRLGEALGIYSWMLARLCEGQLLDKAFETDVNVSVDAYLHMIDCKTGALLSTALDLGGLVGGAPEHARAQLREAGEHLGRAFQIQDDLLDLVADDARWGKSVGGDLVEGKKTFLLLRAIELAGGADKRWFQTIVERPGLAPEAVDEARSRMEALGVLDEAANAVRHHSEQALEVLSALPRNSAADTLGWLVRRMQVRLH